MKSIYLSSLAFLVASALPTVSIAAGDANAGKTRAAACMGCHGVPSYNNVYPTYHVPKLGGQHADYLVAALQAYKSGQRSHPTMRVQAESLSEQDIQNLAAFFAQSGN